MAAIGQTFRFAARQLRKSPGFTITAVLTLALGIGANVAVFSVMNAVLLNPSGVPHPERVVALRAKYGFGDLSNISMSAPDFYDALTGKEVLASAAMLQQSNFNYSPLGGTPERLITAEVTSQWFDVFLAQPMMGRGFRPEEDVPAANHEVVLSYATWKGKFGADPGIVGRSLRLNQQSYLVVGVMPASFAWPNNAEIWTPLGLPPAQFKDANNRHNEAYFAVGRMQEGVTLDQVNTYLNRKADENIASEGANSFSRRSGWGMFAMPLVDFVSGSLRKPLNILLASVVLILLIACANIAGLQLARATARQREVSIQIALGASRARLIQSALAESSLLALAGVVLGILIARISIPALLLLSPASLSGNITVQTGGMVLLAAAAAGVVAALLCGTAPAWHMTRIRWFQSLQETGRSETSSRARQRLRSALVVAEIAAAMLLLAGAGLLTRSLERVERVDTGFDSTAVMTAVVSLPDTKYKEETRQEQFYLDLAQQMSAQPGVHSVAISDSLPFANLGGSSSFEILGRPTGPGDPGPHAYSHLVSPGYFATLRIPLLRGRYFTEADRANTSQVAIIDDVLAKQYWPNQDPIGQHVIYDEKKQPSEIVGIVKQNRRSSLEADGSEGSCFLPMAQYASPTASVAVRANGSKPEALVGAMQAAVHAVDPDQPIYSLKSMDQLVDESLVGRRFLVVLLSIFAGLALLLSALGLYGVISYGVKLRLRELGIRVALGAQRNDVLRLVLRQGLRLAVTGLVIGVFGVFLAGRALSSLLYQVSLFNPVALLSSASLLTAAVLIASYLPAQRAARLDPMQTLREE
jgi:predicted permease